LYVNLKNTVYYYYYFSISCDPSKTKVIVFFNFVGLDYVAILKSQLIKTYAEVPHKTVQHVVYLRSFINSVPEVSATSFAIRS